MQEYLSYKQTPIPLGPPYTPRHRPTVGSWEGAFSHERGNPVPKDSADLVLAGAWFRCSTSPIKPANFI